MRPPRRTAGWLPARAAVALMQSAHELSSPHAFWTLRAVRDVLDRWNVEVTFETANDHTTRHRLAGPYETREAAEAFIDGFWFQETEASDAALEIIDATDDVLASAAQVVQEASRDIGRGGPDAPQEGASS